MSGVSLDVGYFRRNFVNFSVQDNRAVDAGDYERFTITGPTDPSEESQTHNGVDIAMNARVRLDPERNVSKNGGYVDFEATSASNTSYRPAQETRIRR